MQPTMKKILIIEDDKMIKTILQFMLNREGYQTDFAIDGKEGMEKLNPNRPVFVVSSLGNESVTVEKAIEQGANEILSKPFNPEDILEKLRLAFLAEAV